MEVLFVRRKRRRNRVARGRQHQLCCLPFKAALPDPPGSSFILLVMGPYASLPFRAYSMPYTQYLNETVESAERQIDEQSKGDHEWTWS